MAQANKQNLEGKTLEELQLLAGQKNWPGFTARQIAEWIYKNRAGQIDRMTNIPKRIRKELEKDYSIGWRAPADVQVSSDGTKKYLFPTRHDGLVESAYIPEGKRHTLCISSQVGCRMGCSFCMTARQGLQGQLTAGEILNQIHSLPETDLLTNIVYMGMGEPFDNMDAVMKSLEILTSPYGYAMSPRRITVSTIGLIPEMQHFLENSRCNLAVSLHSPFDDERRKLIPMQKIHPVEEVIRTIERYSSEKQRRVSFEYIVFKNLNHSPKHIKALARLLHRIRCRVNLMRFHPVPGSELQSPDDEVMQSFKTALEEKGITTTIRKSRGTDIQAACGQLSTDKKKATGQ